MALAQNQPKYVFSDLMAQTRKRSKQPIEEFMHKNKRDRIFQDQI